MATKRAQQSEVPGEPPVTEQDQKDFQEVKIFPPRVEGKGRLIRSAYDGSRHQLLVHTGSESLVQQAHMREADINYIVEKFSKTGELPTRSGVPEYGDAPDQDADFAEIQRRAAVARTLWEELPEERQALYGSLDAFLADPVGQPQADSNSPQEPVEAPSAGSEGSNETPEPAQPIDPLDVNRLTDTTP